jgi:hypothetical protein
LLPELEQNLKLIVEMQDALSRNEISIKKLDVAAWETISKGGLLLGLKPEEITSYLHVYRLTYQANEWGSRSLDLSVGITSALSKSPQIKEFYMNNWRTTLAELQDALLKIGIKKAEPH